MLNPPPQDTGLARARTGVIVVAGAGLASGVLGLLSGKAEMGPTLLGASLVVAAGAWALSGLRPAPTPQPATDDAVAVPERSAYEDALENLPDPLMVVTGGEPDDLAGKRLAFANAAARTLLRIPKEGALLLSAIRRPEVLEAVDESLFGGLSTSVRFETGGAQNRFWHMWTAPLPARNGRSLALVVMRDETDARRNERMRADFMANASHELRTPLASLSGFIETLRGHAKDDEKARERFLGIMAVQADRMARLVDDLMSLSRIEQSEHIRPEGECDLGAAASDMVDAIALLAKDRQVELKLDLPTGDRAVVAGDRDQILQVIQNLMDNALKYSPQGAKLCIGVRTGLRLDLANASDPASPRLADPDGGRLQLLTPDRAAAADLYASIRVTDQGPGMERRHLPRLAERFYRVEGQKSGERSGTGLGLAIVKHIINRHRGGLWVESAPGKGAVFCAYFPCAGDATARSVTKPS
jgi:two-component system phosphate regulon sensor histidine kinase PhoR